MSLTTQERNLIGIYHSGSREDTIAQMREALPHVDEPDVRAAMENAIAKLDAMSGEDFAALAFDTETDGVLA